MAPLIFRYFHNILGRLKSKFFVKKETTFYELEIVFINKTFSQLTLLNQRSFASLIFWFYYIAIFIYFIYLQEFGVIRMLGTVLVPFLLKTYPFLLLLSFLINLSVEYNINNVSLLRFLNRALAAMLKRPQSFHTFFSFLFSSKDKHLIKKFTNQ